MILKLIFFYIIIVVSITVCNSKKPNFITNGIPTTIHNYPFVVSVQWRSNHICTGNLLTESHVLTTAHCVLSETHNFLSNFKIIAGTADRFNRSASTQVRNIARIVYHENYNARKFWKNDLAILTTEYPFFFNHHTRAVNIQQRSSFDGGIFKSVGWNNHCDNLDNFQEIRLKKMRNAYCTNNQLDVSQKCATIIGNAYMTNGDSGCPLIYNNQLTGIISLTFIENKYSVIYIDIWIYIGWIRNIILV